MTHALTDTHTHSAPALPAPPRWWWPPVVAVVVVAAGLILVRFTGPLISLPGLAESWAAITVAITLQALPFLILGVLVSAVISAFVPESFVRRVTPRNEFLAVPVVATSGLFLPGCECASVPVAQSLIRRGIPASPALSFLLSSPAINPVVLVATAVAFNGQPMMAVARFAASLLAAILVGWAWMSLGTDIKKVATQEHHHGGTSRLDVFRASAMHDLMNAGGFLAMGAMVAALIKVLVPRSWFVTINQTPLVAVLVMAALAVLLCLCSEADAFVAASFVGVSPTAQLVFLVVGPMVDLKLIAMQYGAWGRGFVLRFVPNTVVVSVLSACLVGGVIFGGL